MAPAHRRAPGEASWLEETLDSRRIYSGKIVKLRVDRVALPNRGEAVREIVDHPGGVAIVAVDDAGRVLLVRQYRYAAGRELVELPAGTLEPGEPPAACAARELEEETGYRATQFELLSSFYPTPGYTTELLHVFWAAGLIPGQPRPEADERIEILAVPWDAALAMVASGEIVDAKTIIGLLTASARRAGSARP